MRFAILSDLHANLQAWRAVAADIRAAGVDQVVCLGDIVGYGPNPAEVLEEVASLADHVVLGNHDAVIGGRFDSDCFSDQARIAIEWTQSRLNQSAAEYFQQVPALLRGEGFAVSHAEFQIPERFDYIFEPHEALPSFRATEDNVMFFGHTHVPGVFRLDRETGEADLIKPGQLMCNPAYRYLINVGSVGDPRDGDTRASYAIFDAAQQRIDFRKVAFDIPAYQSALRRSRLPTQPMFFQFLDPNITPAVSATRTRVFRAGEAQVQRAAQSGGARTMVLDPTRRSAGIRAAGSGAFAQRGRTPQRRRQIAVTLGICALVFGGLAAWLIRGSVARPGGAETATAALPAVQPSQLGADLALLLAGEPGPLGALGQGASLSAGVRPAPGVLGQGLLVLTPGDAVTWTPPAVPAGMTCSWWMATPADGDGLLWAAGDAVQLSRRGDTLVLRQRETSSVWGALPRDAVTPMPWAPLSIAGQSFSIAARVRALTDGVLYSETPTNGTSSLTLALRGDRIELAVGTNRWASAPVVPRPNEWRAVAVAYDHARGRMHFFQDGQPAGEAPADLDALPGAVARIGSGQPGTPSVSGELDDLWIFRRSLSAGEARGLADFTLEPGLSDSAALLHHATFDQNGVDGFASGAGRGFNLVAPASITAPGAAGRGRALRLTGGDDIRFTPGFAESGEESVLFGLPRPAGWHHVALVVRPAEGGAGAATVSLWWDGVEVALREGSRDWTTPAAGTLRWPGPVQLDEIAAWTRALRPTEVRELAARTYATRTDHPLGVRLVPGWLGQDEALLTSLAMEGGTKPENLSRILADLTALEQRVRGTALHARALERLADCQRRVAAEVDRIAQQIQAQSSPTSAKGEHEKAALLWENYAGPFAAELAQRRKDRAAHYRLKITVAAEKSRQENDAFYRTAWTAAATALQAADWPALEALAARAGALSAGADPSGPVTADAALLRRLADTPRRAGEALDKLQGQNVVLEFEGQKEASFHVLGLEAGGLQIARMEPDGRNRRLVVPLAKLSLRTLAARLPADDSVDLAAIRACAFAQLGRLDKAVAELQARPHPLSDQLRARIIAAPASAP